MADTNFKGAFWGSEVRKRQARSYWPIEAENTDGVDMSSANTVLLLNGEGTNGAQNNTFLDSSIANVTITRNGNATQGSLSPFVPGGWSVYFDGTTDGIATASTAAAAFGATANNYTVEFWVYPISYDGDYDQYFTAGAVRFGYYPGVGYGMTVAIDDGSSYPGMYKITGGTAPPLHKWSHIAACRSGGTLRLFVNGVQTGNTHNDTYTHGNGTITAASSGASYSPQCYISNARVVKGHALYTGNFTPPRLLPLTPYGSNVQYLSTANVSSSFTTANVSFLSLRGPQFVDDSGSRLTITPAGDSKIVPFSPYRNYTYTTPSYSAYFDGSGDYLSIPNNTAVNLASGNFTIECWIYPERLGGSSQTIFDKDGRSSVSYSSYIMYMGSTGGIRVELGNGTGTSTVPTIYGVGSPLVSPNTWTHIALVKNTGMIQLYFNGILGSNAAQGTTIIDGGQPLLIGDSLGGSVEWKGYISNFRMVKGVAVYTGNFTPPSAPLLISGNSTIYASVANVNTTFASANTSLLTLQDANIFDRSSNAFAITSFGNVQPTIQNPFGETLVSNVEYNPTIYSGSAYFDGSGDYLDIGSNAAFGFGTGNFTIEFWMYLIAAPGSSSKYTLIDFRPNGSDPKHTVYVNNSAGTLYLGFYNGTSDITSSSQPITVNNWVHCVWTKESGTRKIFVNGIQAYSAADSIDYLSARTFRLGGSIVPNEYLFGHISDLRIVKGTALYTSNFVPPQRSSTIPLPIYSSGTAVRTVDYYPTTYDNYPERPEMAFDNNTSTKYYATGQLEANVQLSANVAVMGLTVTTANDMSQRDPTSYEVYGSNTNSSYTLLGSGSLSLSETRFVKSNFISINNANAYGWYRVRFPTNKNGGGATQLSEITLYYYPQVDRITPYNANTSLLLNFQNAGVVDRTGKGVIETIGNGQISTSVYKYGGPSSVTPASTSGSIYFDGSGDGLYLRPSPMYALGSGDFTIEMWVYFNSTASGQSVISGYSSSSALNWTIYTGTNTLLYYLSSNGTSWDIVSGGNIGSIATSTWYHVALVRSGSTIKPYINGVAGTATTSSAIIHNSEPPILAGYFPSSDYFNGYLDDVRITKGQARYDVTQSTISIPKKAFSLF